MVMVESAATSSAPLLLQGPLFVLDFVANLQHQLPIGFDALDHLDYVTGSTHHSFILLVNDLPGRIKPAGWSH